MPYIKSHSNYVLQSKHQDINDGTIYERDITTIGGVSNFPNGQSPIYRSNDFIVSVRSDNKTSNQYNVFNWEENKVSGTVWNLQSISGLTSRITEDNDTKIVLKQDYYDLNDFAYYGSLTELFRTSVTDILNRFPGELYVTNHNVYYTSSFTEDFETIEDSIILGDSSLYEVSNPFGINIHSTLAREDDNALKYFANDGYNNYEIISGETSSIVTKWILTYYYSKKSTDEKYTYYTATTTSSTVYSSDGHDKFMPCKGDKIADIVIGDDDGHEYNISAWVGDSDEVIYLSNANGISIRPQKIFLDEFYNQCDNFEKLLMDRETDYTAIFSVIRENEFGYYRELVPFKFPKGEGGYNIDASEYGFNEYTNNMVKIGEYYDEKFTDNLWRSMTHEAIKNFDWTYTREFQQGDEEEYVFGGQRIQKALRIFAREFDEILSYINNIKNTNKITYDERNNVPDYFLTDIVKNEGWDVKLIYPYTLIEKDKNGNEYNDWSKEGGYSDECNGQLNNTNDNGDAIVREFSQDANSIVIPYTKKNLEYENGYFNMCSSDDLVPASSITDTIRYDEKALSNKGVFKNVIKLYSDNIKWSYQEINNEFLRRLKINSPYIWRHKGTIEGIEMLLGAFGMKSKRWCAAKGISNYDFDVTEYTSFAHKIEEAWDAVHQDYRINWVNSTKTIAYDNRSISNYSKFGIERTKIPYQGIPVAYRDEYPSDEAYIGKTSLDEQLSNGINASSKDNCFTREDGTPVLRRYLYPNFTVNEELDGNPYFQMNGGWLSKTIKSGENLWNFQYDVNNNIVYSPSETIPICDCFTFVGDEENNQDISNNETIDKIKSDKLLYKETVRNIMRVDNINELFSIPTNKLYNGIICNVSKIEDKSAVIDGVIYPIQSEWYSEGDSAYTVYYVSFIKNNGYISVGLDKYFDSSIIVYNNAGEETFYNIEDKSDGYEVKAYLKKDNSFICKEDSDGNYSISSFIRLDTTWGNEDKSYSNYFMLDDVNYSTEISRFNTATKYFTSGWRRLAISDNDYIKINTIINYYNGNNPHNGNMVYDNGHEYFTYFKRLFKHAIDNELFDARCYDDFYASLDNEISKYGFNGLIDEDENIKKYNDFLKKDSKIHYFGNYRDNFGKIWIYGQDKDRIENYKYIYSPLVDGYILNDDSMINGTPYPNENDVDEVTNQIVNNKVLSISFKLHSKWYLNQGQCEVKYLDDIVMNYLTQMIPSSTILQIKYISND